MDYELHVDDSGNREYDPDRNYETSGRLRHFIYGGILLSRPNATRLIERYRLQKLDTFGTPDIEIKSNWLRIEREREKRYLQPFGLSLEDLTAFSDSCYVLLREAELELIGVAVDKLHMQQTYTTPWLAPTVAYEYLMQRAVQAVPTDATLSVSVDDIGGKTAAHREYRELLSRHHEQLRQRGSRLLKHVSFGCLTGPVRFRTSEHSDMIQLADLVAYCVFRQFRDHPDAWESTDSKTLETYPYLGRLAKKFRRGPGDRIQGFGIVKVPLIQRVPWKLTAKEKL